MSRSDESRAPLKREPSAAPSDEWIDESEVRAFIQGSRETSERRGDHALVAALDAVELALEDWRSLRLEATRREQAWRITSADLRLAGSRLKALVVMVATLQEQEGLCPVARGPMPSHHDASPPFTSRWHRLRARLARTEPAPMLTGTSPAAHPRQVARASITAPADSLAKPTGDPEPGPSTEAELAAQMLGSFTVLLGGHSVNEWRSAKAKSVLRYLLAHRDRPVAKEALQEVLWPEADPEVARRNLHQAVYTLRRNLRPYAPGIDLVMFERDCYMLNAVVRISCDVDAFEANAASGRHRELAGDPDQAAAAYQQAVRLYVGDYLEDAPYDEWTIVTRNRLRIAFVETAHRLGDLLLARGSDEEAITVSQRLLHFDPADEAAHRRIMKSQHARGQRNLAIRQYQTCVEAVRGQLDLPPSAETIALLRVIRG
jgi:DNA-binding SARP family transcriptional activator